MSDQEAIKRIREELEMYDTDRYTPANPNGPYFTGAATTPYFVVRTDDLRALLNAYDARAPREVKLYNCGEDGMYCSLRCRFLTEYERYSEDQEMKEIEERMKYCSHLNMDLEDGCLDCGYNSK